METNILTAAIFVLAVAVGANLAGKHGNRWFLDSITEDAEANRKAGVHFPLKEVSA